MPPELVRVVVDPGRRDADEIEQIDSPAAGLPAARPSCSR